MSKDIEKESFGTKFIDFVKTGRFWILFIFVFLSLFAVNYTFNSTGVVINGIVPGSNIEIAGAEFSTQDSLRSLERIEYLNDYEVEDVSSFYSYLDSYVGDSILVKTNKKENGYLINLNSSLNETVLDQIGVSVRDAPVSNIKLGIELEGGSRLILKVKDNISESDYDILVNALQSRLDVFGASGTKVRKLDDAFSAEKFVIVESTSSNKNDIFDLISRQGNFIAKVGEDQVFTGDNVVRVFSDPQNARFEGCRESNQGFICTYAFLVEIDTVGTQSFFDKTSQLNVVGSHLSEEVSFHLDGEEITSLSIASSFKYQKIPNPQISVSGDYAPTREAGIKSAQKEMKFLQTILSTQSLPSELEVAQSYSISSSLGKTLLDNAVLVGLAALLIVSAVVALRYREFAIFVAIFVALITEVIIVFGMAAFMRISIDLAAIGGLIAAIGTGVDDQIVITDEQYRKRRGKKESSKNRFRTAMRIILIAYITTVVAMLPFLFSASLSLVKGFAFMTIAGVTIGVLVTRPAYATFLRILKSTRKEREEEQKEFD